jgi:hypothetical protein
MKIRVVGSPLFLDTFTALGANPTQMSWADAQPAMASGAVDGQENPIGVYMAAKLQSVGQKHLTMWGYMNDPLIFVVNKDVGSWTPADQAIVKQAALDAAKEEIAIARKGLVEADKPLLKDLAGLGVTVTTPNAAEREAFVKATAPSTTSGRARSAHRWSTRPKGHCCQPEISPELLRLGGLAASLSSGGTTPSPAGRPLLGVTGLVRASFMAPQIVKNPRQSFCAGISTL